MRSDFNKPVLPLAFAISQNRHTTATQSSREAFNLLSVEIDALHSALLSIAVVSEKVRAAREMLSAMRDAPARLGKPKTICGWPKQPLAASWDSVCVPRCWPPELVATDLDGELNCPVCGRISHQQGGVSCLLSEKVSATNIAVLQFA